MNELQVFKNEEFGEVRSLKIGDEPWFVGKDVADILGYTNSRKAISDHVDDEDKGVTKCDTLGGKQDLTIINESGLYSLILSSKLPTAKKFKRWVTSEVLPAIRKTGSYQIPDNPMDALKLMFEAQTQTNDKVEHIQEDVKELKDNKLLNPGQYNYLGTQIRKRVRAIKEVRKLNLTTKQNSKLYSFINRDLNKYVGIRTRSQFKEKDFEKALNFISEWDLSYTDLKIIEEMES
ncbi:phage repressor protein [Erysipelatoclostridium sp. An173]|uniref:BRO family protein n=1 Tax=Erysipelatoclostridium sp. An173 TaxID=1965571 RepID=UPI000B36A3DA|nr:BRO family protein [Erysipelatoclostridium sp. An173]OUP77208.1 phage repressor protein [Erysipelatoclostridium sp. An173]